VNPRGLNLLHSVPAEAIDIASLFRVMKNAVVEGITCSSSTLEKVFLDLVLRSEATGEP
jgi:hypothetical protein